ncbi:MAG: hypothetical protein M3M96_09660, partial [Candidatus Eremiobacteraeota bacterium]|nr:hypothetical protein [Candidatus Eremiobacteraeota bacterium]
PKYLAFGRLIALTQAQDGGERARLAQSALSVAKQSHGPFLLTLCALAVGMVDPSSADQAFELAYASAAQCDAPTFRAAVEAAISGRGNTGVLRAFMSYLARQETATVAPLHVDVVSGSVKVDGRSVVLSGRELELVVALASPRYYRALALSGDVVARS